VVGTSGIFHEVSRTALRFFGSLLGTGGASVVGGGGCIIGGGGMGPLGMPGGMSMCCIGIIGGIGGIGRGSI
jgi:hypothetical protein